MKHYSAKEAYKRLYAGTEIALLDVREAGQFGEGHALFAVPAPYNRLEKIIEALVPRNTVAIILIDNGDGIGERAARRMDEMGYTHIGIIDSGLPGQTQVTRFTRALMSLPKHWASWPKRFGSQK